MAGDIKLAATLDKLNYPLLPRSQMAYLLLEAVPAGEPPVAAIGPLNLSLVLDRSGSMAGEKLVRMKEAACALVDRLGPADWLSVVAFDDRVSVPVRAGPVSDREAVKRRIQTIDERGGTHLSKGIEKGLEQIRAGLSPERVSRIVLLTDGQTWEDVADCEKLAAECGRSGVPLSVLGLGKDEDWDPAFLSDLAGRSGGEWEYVDTPDKISSVFASTVSSMQSTAVTNALLTLRLAPDVSPRAVWRVRPLISRLDHRIAAEQEVQIFLGDIHYPRGQSVLAEFVLPPRSPGAYRLLHADVVYDVPGTGMTSQKEQIEVMVGYLDDPVRTALLNDYVLSVVERVVAHKLQTIALDEATSGQSENATRRLRAAATRLLEMGEDDLAQQTLEQASQLEQHGEITREAHKALRYATRKLTRKLPETEGPTRRPA